MKTNNNVTIYAYHIDGFTASEVNLLIGIIRPSEVFDLLYSLILCGKVTALYGLTMT